MPCLKPIRIKNPKYIGVPLDQIRALHPLIMDHPDSDLLPFDYYLDVPCGKCLPCQQSKSVQYRIRLMEQWSRSLSAHFVTLTIAPEFYTTDTDLDLYRLYLNRFLYRVKNLLKKTQTSNNQLKIHYFIISEHGDVFNRFHFHGVFFDWPSHILCRLDKIWTYGKLEVSLLTPERVNYVCKYANKIGQKELPTLRVRTSIGLGLQYLNSLSDHKSKKLANDPVYRSGTNIYGLPRYYRRYLYQTTDDKDMASILNHESPSIYRLNSVLYENESEYKAACEAFQETLKQKKLIKRTKKFNRLKNLNLYKNG